MDAVDPRYHDPLLGVAFDLDGTLVVSPHPYDRMRRETIRIAEHHGVHPSQLSPNQTIPSLVATAGAEIEHAGLPEGTRYRFEAEVNKKLDEIEVEGLGQTTERPGARELLEALTNRGYRVGVLTRSCLAFTRGALRRTGLDQYVRSLRTRSSPGPVKPEAEALLILLRDLEVPVERAVFVGDHRMDAECALGAHVRFYALLPVAPGELGTDTERFRAAGATAVARDLEELGRQLGVFSAASVLPAT